ncbi:cyclic AMP-dependent transcription factor ATF-7b isoform X1 [Polypterus senegalus]|nr:cyclic AMP-dependent transcription factor ATF-7b isoform X1 [Polypterus senegalus]
MLYVGSVKLGIMGDDRPFVCSAPGCGQRFTNEDHLAVHKHKHEMTLKFGPARTDSVIIADQTPTPTRFLKNCEEVGLFNELASSFEPDFPRSIEDDDKRSKVTPGSQPGVLDMSLSSTPDVKVKEEEHLDVDSTPPDSPISSCSIGDNEETKVVPLVYRHKNSAGHPQHEIPPKPVANSAPTPAIVRPGSLPLHFNYDPLQPTLPSPTSVITQAPPSNRQLGSPTTTCSVLMQLPSGQSVPCLPGPHMPMTSVISLARPLSMVPNIPGIPGPPLNSSSGSTSPSSLHTQSEAKMRLKAALSHQAPGGLNGAMMMGAASSMVASRQEQSQLLVQQPDAPSPAQPQVSPAQPTGGRRRRAADDDPDERRQRFLERNRAAASRCRQKRKLWVNSLEKKAEELTSMNVQLSNEVSSLRNEVAHLKQLLLAHKDCPVTTQQKKTAYLGEESPKDSTEPIGSPAAVIQHSSLTVGTAAHNGLNTRAAAEIMATSVLAGMGSQRTELGGPIPAHVIIAPQSQSAGR